LSEAAIQLLTVGSVLGREFDFHIAAAIVQPAGDPDLLSALDEALERLLVACAVLPVRLAQELRGLPDFRRNAGYTAFIEGWGLYAESLGAEMPGFYTDPYSRFGQLTYEMWRACRLVVDTGMHHLGWSRQRAIDFMKENTAKSEQDIVVEIDRYIVWPGQALAYKIGELKIKQLRARAQRELGPRFDVRKFHNALLDNGPLPLDVLEREMDRWIASQKTRT
jgi:uncharacterized protein (DUF885 family)